MSRIARSGLVVFALLLSLFVVPAAGAAPAPGPGNSPNAKACQKGGYANYVRSDGTTFANQDECVSYAARGGTLESKSVADLVVTSTRQPTYMSFVVTGTGFLPNTESLITFQNSDGYVAYGSFYTDANGSFSRGYTWPCGASREGTVTVTDGTNTASETYPICH